MYSWSKINMFDSAERGEGCYYAYYLQYIKRENDKIDNFFSELGKIVHEFQLKIINEEIFEWEIKDELIKAFTSMEYKAPFKPQKSYFDPIIKFFVEDGCVELKKYTIIGTESFANVNIAGISIIVKPDFLAEHDEKGLILGDTKISKPYMGDELQHKLRQLYIYSEYVKSCYDIYPDYLMFIYPREPLGKREYFYEFDLKKLNESKKFVCNTIEKIEKHSDWKPRCEELNNPNDDFYASELCSFRHICPIKCEKVKKYEDDDIFFEWFE